MRRPARKIASLAATTTVEFEWWRRRVAIAGVLIFCGLGVGYLIIWGRDMQLHRDIANGLILLAGTTLGSYVFGATWDDASKRRTIVDTADIASSAGADIDPAALTTATTTAPTDGAS